MMCFVSFSLIMNLFLLWIYLLPGIYSLGGKEKKEKTPITTKNIRDLNVLKPMISKSDQNY